MHPLPVTHLGVGGVTDKEHTQQGGCHAARLHAQAPAQAGGVAGEGVSNGLPSDPDSR